MPRVSILLTCYNHLPFIPAAVESVRAQTFQDYELIAIDDGSTDGTREWLVANLLDGKVVLNESNVGTYATLNIGLANATGEFIAILNDDDVWSPTKLQGQIELLDQLPNVGLVHTDGRFIDASGQYVEGSPLGFQFPRTRTGDVLLDLMYANKIIASATLIRKRCFDELGGFNAEYFGSGDWEMWIRIAEKWKVGYLDEDLTQYRVHGHNASHKLDRIWQDDEKLRKWLDERSLGYANQDPVKLRRARAHNLACLGTVLTLNGNPRKGRSEFAASIKLEPTRLKSYARWVATFMPRTVFRKLG